MDNTGVVVVNVKQLCEALRNQPCIKGQHQRLLSTSQERRVGRCYCELLSSYADGAGAAILLAFAESSALAVLC